MKSIAKSILFPCLLSFITLASMFYIYDAPEVFPVTLVIVFIANFLLFVLYEKLRVFNKKQLTAVVIIVLIIIAFSIFGELISSQGRWSAFREFPNWFYRSEGMDGYYPHYVTAVIVLFTTFLSMAIFYFANANYNSFFLMMTCMVTFALYAKTFTDIPFIFPSLIIALFLFISIEKRWYKQGAQKALSYGKFALVGGIFVALSAYIAGLFPPVEFTPYREKFDEMISGQNLSFMAEGLNLDSNESGSAPDSRTNVEMVLFKVKADKSGYLRRQVFDNWTGEGWLHYRDDEKYYNQRLVPALESSPPLEWAEFFANYENTEKLSANESELLGLRDLAPKPTFRRATITTVTNMEFWLFPAPPYSTNINRETDTKINRGIRDEYFNANFANDNAPYEVKYYDNNADGAFLSRLTPSVAKALSDAGKTNYMSGIFPLYYDDYLKSCLEVENYPERARVRALAFSLTSDYESDYEKALALERYFYNGEFTYDLDFVPESKALDYFLFESKTGTCSDFASAMTIMAREIGLSARYVEGYIMNEYDDVNEEFVVRVKHGHAFPEVFIKGWGWVIFEPTIPPIDTGSDFGYAALLGVLLTGGGLIVLTILFVLFALPVIKEQRFRAKALRSDKTTQAKMFYEKIYATFIKRLRLNARTLSSRDLNAISNAELGAPLMVLTENYDRAVYGGLEARDEDFYGIYKRFIEAVKSERKKK